MAKFVFRLQAVLRQRKAIEDERQREYAGAQARLAQAEGELRALDASMRASEDDLRNNRLIGKIDLNFLAAHRRFRVAMQRKAMELAENIARVSIQVDEARKKLIEAARNKKILEKLRERWEARWKEEQGRKQMIEMDEVSMRLAQEEIAREHETADKAGISTENNSMSEWNAV